MAVYHLHKWSVCNSGPVDPYVAPEACPPSLSGFRDNETKAVVTSTIVKVDGKVVTTKSGSVYILEDVDPEYVKWMEDNGFVYDPENPIKVK